MEFELSDWTVDQNVLNLDKQLFNTKQQVTITTLGKANKINRKRKSQEVIENDVPQKRLKEADPENVLLSKNKTEKRKLKQLKTEKGKQKLLQNKHTEQEDKKESEKHKTESSSGKKRKLNKNKQNVDDSNVKKSKKKIKLNGSRKKENGIENLENDASVKEKSTKDEIPKKKRKLDKNKQNVDDSDIKKSNKKKKLDSNRRKEKGIANLENKASLKVKSTEDETTTKKKRNKKKKNSSKKNKYKHLDEERARLKLSLSENSTDPTNTPHVSNVDHVKVVGKETAESMKHKNKSDIDSMATVSKTKKKKLKKMSGGFQGDHDKQINNKTTTVKQSEKKSGSFQGDHGKQINNKRAKQSEKKNEIKSSKIQNEPIVSKNEQKQIVTKNEQKQIVSKNEQKQQKGNKNVPFKLSKLQKVLSDKDKQHVGKEQAVKGDKSGNLETEKDNHSGKEQAVKGDKSVNLETETQKKTEKQKDVPMSLRDRLVEQLKSARFRYINQQLYTQTGSEAAQLFKGDKDSFHCYHEGFQNQVEKWPTNPVDIIIQQIKAGSSSAVIGDFGCGDAKIARSIPNKVHSFDLVALNKHVTVCNIEKVPLKHNCLDIAVFCLSLMGTNLAEYIEEANRVLKKGGTLMIAEVTSRIQKIGKFVRNIERMGFEVTNKDTSNSMFILVNFKKTGTPSGDLPEIQLDPCVYKKR